MKILFLSVMFPPHVKGGAELCAYQSALWLTSRGHEIGVLTVARDKTDEIDGEMVNGLQIWRLAWPRPYPPHDNNEYSGWKKVLWHLQDHFDPRNKEITERVVRQFQPDLIYIHHFIGIGSNVFSVFRKHNIPVSYHVHDLAFACLRCPMFNNGKACETKCTECQLSSAVRMRQMNSLRQPCQFISPSRNTLTTLQSFVDLSGHPTEVVPNLDLELPKPRIPRGSPTDPVRIIYVGRLHPSKGVRFLLEVLEDISHKGRAFRFTVVGTGPDENSLRERFRDASWVTFIGAVPPERVRDFISDSDLLCTPSICRENHPDVVRKAIRAGVPALVSRVGGIPEMVEHNHSGMVLEPGDVEAWTKGIVRLLDDSHLLAKLQQGASDCAVRYSTDSLGEALETTLKATPGLIRPGEVSKKETK